jgi:hypothetical protein
MNAANRHRVLKVLYDFVFTAQHNRSRSYTKFALVATNAANTSNAQMSSSASRPEFHFSDPGDKLTECPPNSLGGLHHPICHHHGFCSSPSSFKSSELGRFPPGAAAAQPWCPFCLWRHILPPPELHRSRPILALSSVPGAHLAARSLQPATSPPQLLPAHTKWLRRYLNRALRD